MKNDTIETLASSSPQDDKINSLYRDLLKAWNRQSAQDFAALLFAARCAPPPVLGPHAVTLQVGAGIPVPIPSVGDAIVPALLLPRHR